MKKFLGAVLAVVLGAVSLFAGDAEDIKALLIKDLELGASGDFAGALALRTPDFVETTDLGTFTVEHTKWMILALDGKHPEEFLLLSAAIESRGAFKKPTPEQMARIREAARDPEFLQWYAKNIPVVLANIKDDCALQLKTLKFVGIKVEGDSATAVIEFDHKNPEGVRHRSGTVFLRKVDGKWMICRAVIGAK